MIFALPVEFFNYNHGIKLIEYPDCNKNVIFSSANKHMVPCKISINMILTSDKIFRYSQNDLLETRWEIHW